MVTARMEKKKKKEKTENESENKVDVSRPERHTNVLFKSYKYILLHTSHLATE